MNDKLEQYSLLLLAGGKSSRMGQDKGNLLYEGRTFIDILLEKAEEVGIQECYLSGHSCSRADVQVVTDVYKDCGPLGGLQACMQVIKTPYCLVLPVDVPQIPVNILKNLICAHKKLIKDNPNMKALILKNKEREEPLLGVYATELEEQIAEQIHKEKYSVFGFLNEIGYQTLDVEIDSWKVDNINTPQAYAQLMTKSMNNGE